MQDKEKAVAFLRVIKELLFLEKKNITKWEYISLAAQKAELDVAQLKKDYEGDAKKLFGVRGFPTMLFVDSLGNQEKIYGSKPYAVFENAVTKLQPSASKYKYDRDWKSLFAKHSSLTSLEFAELSETSRTEADVFLQKLHEAGSLDKLDTKNGAI